MGSRNKPHQNYIAKMLCVCSQVKIWQGNDSWTPNSSFSCPTLIWFDEQTYRRIRCMLMSCFIIVVCYLIIFFLSLFLSPFGTLNAQHDTYVRISCFKNEKKLALLSLSNICAAIIMPLRSCIWIFVAVNISIFAKAYLHETLIITCARAIYTFTVVMWRGHLHVQRYLFILCCTSYHPLHPHTYTCHPLRVRKKFLFSAPNAMRNECVGSWKGRMYLLNKRVSMKRSFEYKIAGTEYTYLHTLSTSSTSSSSSSMSPSSCSWSIFDRCHRQTERLIHSFVYHWYT